MSLSVNVTGVISPSAMKPAVFEMAGFVAGRLALLGALGQRLSIPYA